MTKERPEEAYARELLAARHGVPAHVSGQPLAPHEERDLPFFRFATDAGYAIARKFFGIPEIPKPVA